MDCTDNRSATARKKLEQIDALETCGAVKAASWFIEEHNRRIIDQLQSDR